MLEIKNMFKTFNPGTANENRLFQGFSLQLRKGEYVTLLGGNGSGKSTLLNCIAGVHFTEQGTITIAGQNVTNWPEHRRAQLIGRVFQDPMLGTCANMSIEENLALAFRRGTRRGLAWGIRRQERARFRELLSTLELGLENRLNNKVGLLSGGQRQALTLLMATITRPKLLLLDEHTAALDPKTAQKVLELTDRLIKENGLTALMVTHNLRDALLVGNRVVMLQEGSVILDKQGEERAELTANSLFEYFNQDTEATEHSYALLA